MRAPVSLCAAALLALAAIPSAQTVHVVDQLAGPGADFNSVRTAVEAAVSGDVILVRTGDYLDDVEIDGKSLIIQEEFQAQATILTVEVRNLPAGGYVTIRGLDVLGGGVVQRPALRTVDCAGSVWFEDMTISGSPMAFFSGGGSCENSDQVVLTRCHIEQPFNLPLPSLVLEDSSVTLYETLIEGLNGSGGVFITTPGEDAIGMTDGELFVYGSTILGGTGGAGVGVCGEGSAGGAAIVMDGANPAVTVLDSTVQGGDGGPGTGTCDDGPAGEDFLMNAPGAMVDTVAASARSYVVSSPGREGGNVQVTFVGQPGDRVWVRYPLLPGPSLFSRFWDGPFLVGLPAPRQFIGTLDATGTLVLNVSLPPDFGPGVEALTFHTQAIFLGTRFVMSPPSFLLGLDQSF